MRPFFLRLGYRIVKDVASRWCNISHSRSGETGQERTFHFARKRMLGEKDKLRRTELHYACADSDVQRVRALLDAGGDPSEADVNGWTPLHFAAQANCAEAVESLIKAGAAVDPEDRDGNTPLWKAVFNSRGHEAVIKVLLEAGANPAHENRHGVSPRSLAKTISNYDVARYFN